MLKVGDKKIGYIDSYSKKTNEVKNFDIILKSNNLTREKYLAKVAEDFVENSLINGVISSTEITNKDLFNGIDKKLKRLIKLENNIVHIPIHQFMNIINFTISTELETLNESLIKDSNKIKTISEMMSSEKTVEKEYEVPSFIFEENDLVDIFQKICHEYTNKTEIKNDYFIISFE